MEQKEVIISNAEGSTKALEREKTDLRNQLDNTNRKLQALMDFSYPLSSEPRDEVSVLANYFNPKQAITNCPRSRNLLRGVWRSCLNVVKTNIWKELPVPEKEEVYTRSIQKGSTNHLSEHKSMDNVETGAGGNICDSDTRAAKQMRTFLVMAVLARSLTNHIFTPTYIVEEESELRDLLFEIPDNTRKEFLRGIIMSLFKRKQRESLRFQ